MTLAPIPGTHPCAGSVGRAFTLTLKPPPQFNHLKLQRKLFALPNSNRREQELAPSVLQIHVPQNITNNLLVLFLRETIDVTTRAVAALHLNLGPHEGGGGDNAAAELLRAVLHEEAVVQRRGKVATEKWLYGSHGAVAFRGEVDEYAAGSYVLHQKFAKLDLIVETV